MEINNLTVNPFALRTDAAANAQRQHVWSRSINVGAIHYQGRWPITHRILCNGDKPFLGASIPPRINTNFQLDVGALQVDQLAVVMIGPVIPTLNLWALGAPQCDLYVRPDAFWNVDGTGKYRTATIPIPNLPPLRGVQVYFQAIHAAPGTNALGAVFTNALNATIG